MREIKFRGRDENGKWYYGSLIQTYYGGVFIQVTSQPLDMATENTVFETVEVLPETVGQYTGLKDKNGKEIYEGDLVHYVYQPGEGCCNFDCEGIVEWKSTGFKMTALPGRGGFCGWLVSCPGAYEGSSEELFEIIGNIHDTPELLEDKEGVGK